MGGATESPRKIVPWSSVIADPYVQQLSDEDYDGLRREYFDRAIAPQIEADDIEGVWQEFDVRTKRGIVGDAKAMVRRATGFIGSAQAPTPLPEEPSAPDLSPQAPAPSITGPSAPTAPTWVDEQKARESADSRLDAHPDFDTDFNTVLSQPEEAMFRQWKDRFAPRDSGMDYDLRGAFRAGVTPQNGHFPDTFKKPSHPTFSNESRYAKFGTPGRWEGEKFVPPDPEQVVIGGMIAQAEQDASRVAPDLTVPVEVKAKPVPPPGTPGYREWKAGLSAEDRAVVEADEQPAPQNMIDLRGAPVSDEAFAAIKQRYESSSPQEREAMISGDDVQSRVARKIHESYGRMSEQIAKMPALSILDQRREARQSRYAEQGASAQTAANMAGVDLLTGRDTGLAATAQPSNFDFDTAKKYKPDGSSAQMVNRGAYLGVKRLKQQTLGLHEAIADAIGADEYAAVMGRGHKEAQQEIETIGTGKTAFERNFEGAISSIISQGPGLAIAVGTGAQTVPLLMMSAQVFGQEYASGKAAGLSKPAALARAGIQGAFEFIGERLSLGATTKALREGIRRAVDNVRGSPIDATRETLGNLFLKSLAKENVGEVFTSSGQFWSDAFPGIGLNPDATFDQYLTVIADTIVQTTLQTGIMAGVGMGPAVITGRPNDTEAVAKAESAKEKALLAWDKAFHPEGRREPGGIPVDRAPGAPSMRTASAPVEPIQGMSAERAPLSQQAATEAGIAGAEPDDTGEYQRQQLGIENPVGNVGVTAGQEKPKPGGIAVPQGVEDILSREEPVIGDTAAEEPPQPPAAEPLTETAPQKAYTKKTAEVKAKGLTKAGNPSRVIPHPTEDGKFAVVPKEADATTEQQPPPEAAIPAQKEGVSASTPVDVAAHEAATSPTNDTPQPTEGQKKAGNYRKGAARISGLDISIENPEGSQRSGTDPSGKAWSVTMKSHYGYIRGTVGRDKDHVDVFVKPGTPEDYAGPVFVIDQSKPGNGHFDEHKVMLGWTMQDAAVLAYKGNYANGWNGLGAVTKMSMDEFKGWLESGDTTKPAADHIAGAGKKVPDAEGGAPTPDADPIADAGKPIAGDSVPREAKKEVRIGGYPVSGMGDKALKLAAKKAATPEQREAAQAELARRAAVPKQDEAAPGTAAPAGQQEAEEPIKAYKSADRAKLEAKKLSRLGAPSKVIPHPTEQGKFAVVPREVKPRSEAQKANDARPKEERGAQEAVDKQRQAEIDRKRAEDQLAGQGDIFAQPAAGPDGNVKFSRAAWYRSALTDSIEALPTKQAAAQGWKDQIKGLVAKGQVKQAEVDAVGLNDFLDLQHGRVTRDQMLAFLGENGVRVEDVTLGAGVRQDELPADLSAHRDDDGNWVITDENGVAVGEGGSRQLAENDALNNLAKGEDTKFSQYQLPGGENYRELLLTLPVERESGQVVPFEKWLPEQSWFRSWQANGSDQVEARRLYAQWAEREERGRDKPTFRSSHFDQPNILAHVRFNERIDATGARVLFIEEIQSDWAQKGKKGGFALPSEVTAPMDAEYRALVHKNAEAREAGREPDLADVERARELEAALDRADKSKIPSAPFVPKTEAWVALILKRMIAYASENGFDRIAWTTGEQQVERYSSALRNAVDVIEWKKTPEGVQIVGYKESAGHKDVPAAVRQRGQAAILRNDQFGFDSMGEALGALTQNRADWQSRWEVSDANDARDIDILIGAITATEKARTKVVDTTEKESALSDAIGKSMADRIRNDPSQAGTIEGENITVSDTGMAGFYDKIVPSVANDILKKLGGGKVKEINIGAQENEGVGARGTGMQPAFDITPAMREKALAGLPLFSRTQEHGSDQTIPNEANREATRELERALAKHGHQFTITPVSLPVDSAQGTGQRDASEAGARSDFALAEKIAKLFGKEVIPILAEGDFSLNGVVVPGKLSKYIFIDVRAGHPANIVLGHELGHHLRADAPDIYAELVDAITPLLVRRAEYRDRARLPVDLSEDDVTEEMVNDLIGDRFGEQEFWDAVAQESGGAFKRISRAIRQWLSGLIDRLAGRNGLGSEQFVSDLKAARAALVKATAKYAAKQKAFMGRESAAFAKNQGQGAPERTSPTESAAFRKWFGDWRLASLGQRMRPVRGSDQAKAVRAEIVGRPIRNEETGIVATVSGESFGKMLSESGVRLSVGPQAHMQALGNLDLLFPLATRTAAREGKKDEDVGRVAAIHHFAVPMPFDGEVLAVKILAKEFVDEKHGTRLYLVQAVEIETPASERGESVSSEEGRSPHPPAGVEGRFAQMVAAVKGEGVSKVVDAEGRPLVVYHGTANKFTEFDPSWTDEGGLFFTPDASKAAEYGSNVMPVYMTIKNPYEMTANKWRNESPDLDELADHGYDGAKIKGEGGNGDFAKDTWIAFRPEQIKSAIGNAGAFDPTNPDIRFSRQHELPAEEQTGRQAALADVQTLNDAIADAENDNEYRNAYLPAELDDPGIARAFESTFGVTVVPVRPSADKFNDRLAMQHGGKIYVNIEGGEHGFVQLAGHELLHQIRKDMPSVYDWFAEQAENYLKKNSEERYRLRLEAVGAKGFDTREEILADFVGDSLADPDFLAHLAERNKTKFRLFIDRVIGWLNETAKKLTKAGFGSYEYFNDVKALQGYLGAVLNAYKTGGERDVAPPKYARAFKSVKTPKALTAYREIAQRAIDQVDRIANPFITLPGRKEFMAKRGLTQGRIDEINDINKSLRKAFLPASEADRKAVFSYLVTEGVTTKSISDPKIADAAKDAKDLIRRTGDAMVARGMLDEETRRDSYLPQVYLKYMLDAKDYRALGSGKKPSNMSYLLKRKYELKADQSGKKVALIDRDTGLPVSDEVILSLGPVTDPTYLSGLAIARPLRDMALLDWLSDIARGGLSDAEVRRFADLDARDKIGGAPLTKDEAKELAELSKRYTQWVLPGSTVQWNGRTVSSYWLKEEAARIRKQARYYEGGGKTIAANSQAGKALALADKMDDAADKALDGLPGDKSDYRQIPTSPRMGRMRGVWVRKEIYNDIMGVNDFMPTSPGWAQRILGYGGEGTKAVQIWKMMKVTMNLPGQVRNFASNLVLLNLSGVPAHRIPGLAVKAIDELIHDGRHWKIAKKYGVRASTFSAQELQRLKTEFLEAEKNAGRLTIFGVSNLMARKTANFAGDIYQLTEALSKTAKIMYEMENGASESDAVDEAQKWLFDYSNVPQSVRYLRGAPVGVPFACVDDKTEALTKDGWKGIDAIVDGDEVASFDMETQRLAWKPVKSVYRSEYEGPMVHVHDHHLDMMLTPDHRCVSYRRRRVVGMREINAMHLNLEVVKARDLNVRDHIPVAAEFDRSNEGEPLSNGLVKVLGWVATEGYFHKLCDQVHIYQNASGAQPIRDALTEAGMTWLECVSHRAGQQRVSNGVIVRHNEELVTFQVHAESGRIIRALLPGKKLTPALLHKLTRDQIDLLIETMIDGDGCRSGSQVSFIQKGGETAEAFKMALVMSGRSFGVHLRAEGTEQISIRDGKRYCVKRALGDTVQYKGRIWCPEVPGFTTWVARRDDKVFITGNTFPTKVLPRLIEVAALHPQRYLPLAGLFFGLQYGLAALLDVDYDDLEKLRKAMTKWIQKAGHAVLLPWKDEFGKWQVVDLSYFMPWTYWTNLAKDVGRGELGEAFRDTGAVAGPMLDLATAWRTGKDPFTQRDIADPGDSAGMQALSWLNYHYSLVAPPMLTSRGTLGKAVEAYTGETNRFGDPKRTATQAAWSLFGVNINSIDPVRTRNQNMKAMEREISDSVQRTKERLSELQGPGNEEKRNAALEKGRAEAEKRRAALQKYMEESEIPESLR